MRYLAILFATLALPGCDKAPAPRGESQAGSLTRDSVERFLLTSAATDFHTHPVSYHVVHAGVEPARFRNVRLGHIKTPTGEEQYMLCGEFLPGQGGDKAEWTRFTTLKTSSYEQYVGEQGGGYCQRPGVTWDTGDLSSSLQTRLDSLR